MAIFFSKPLSVFFVGVWVVALVAVFAWLVNNGDAPQEQGSQDVSLQGGFIFSVNEGDTADLKMFSEKTGKTQTLVSRADVDELLPTASSTGQSLAYVVRDSVSEQIWIQTSDTRDLRLLTSSHQGRIRAMQFSPNDRYIAFEEQIDAVPHIYMVDVANGLTTLVAPDAGGFTWGADSLRLFYHTPANGTIQNQRVVSRRMNENQELTDAVDVLAHAVYPVALPDNQLLSVYEDAGAYALVTSTDRGEKISVLHALTIQDPADIAVSVSQDHRAIALTQGDITQVFDAQSAVLPWQTVGLQQVVVESGSAIYGVNRDGIQKAADKTQERIVAIPGVQSLTLMP